MEGMEHSAGGLAGSNHSAPGYRVPRPQTLRPRPPALSQRIRTMVRSSRDA